MDGTVLIADDDRTIRTVLTQALTRAGCKVHATSSLVTLLRWVEEGRGDLVISDVVMPDGNGLQQLPKIAQLRPGLPVIVISAQNTIMTAIQAAEAEAFDYLPKPFDLPDLMKRASQGLKVRRTVSQAPKQVALSDMPDDLPLVGRTPAMQEMYRLIARVMNTDVPVMISGEIGSGKSLIARTMHDLSDRRAMPFVIVSGAQLDGLDILSQTIAKARGGTLLIDGVEDMSTADQARLVRLIDSLGDTSPRLLTTANPSLQQMLTDGAFREDLFYRLNGLALDVPALRERVEDIGPLADHFLQIAAASGGSALTLDEAARARLRTYGWPGNVRQLESAIKRLALTASSAVITDQDVVGVLDGQPAPTTTAGIGAHDKLSQTVALHIQRYFDLHGQDLPPPGLYARILREVEAPLLDIALDATRGNQAKCADLLGINRNTLRKKLTELDIHVTRRRKMM